MPLSLQEISLNKCQIRMLKKIFNEAKIPYSEIKKDKYSSLEYYSLITFSNDKYQITEKGKSYLRHIRKENFRFWVPIIISIAALIVSVIALLG